ncbi:protein serine/threonine phosphatase 2C [Neolentinus lepideus HHB14362 ss-1]|uniref:Protein serine/threonine phosphatase 2C n=1 Tax=Neolentinus lepideus HHB14362 ss-1 TaxID=1314782 RepID=A0A165V739_9AGAM|nr:protein serine/threonine phosphatase 2C [Neolentinus lepideus HHB14362 ss-1]
MLKRAWKPVAAATGVVGASTYLWYSSSRSINSETIGFRIRVRGADGKPTYQNMSAPLLSRDEVEKRIKDNAVLETVASGGSIRWKRATVSLASNDPIEDANVHGVIPKDLLVRGAAGDFLFFAVMDGHAGPYTSRLLTKTLIPAVSLKLSEASMDGSKDGKSAADFLKRLKSLLWSSLPSPPSNGDANSAAVALEEAFVNLDSELINAPLRVLAANIDQTAREKKILPDLSQDPMAMAAIRPALSGSCAIAALIDTSQKMLYVACTGDSRAVVGVYEEHDDGTGSWRVEALSEDQTGRNPKEYTRVRSEHPDDDPEDVIRAGRVLGGLEPTRAFGDARYKWPREIQQVLKQAYFPSSNEMRNPPSLLKTPPYVTARPVVTQTSLSLPSASEQAKQKSTFRFLILATDGLWDRISSEDAVALVGGFLSGLRGAVPKASLQSLIPTTIGTATINGKDSEPQQHSGEWAFVDDHVGTHLLRNALAGASEKDLRELVSIPAPYSRRYRDDITVTVVYWEEQTAAAKL